MYPSGTISRGPYDTHRCLIHDLRHLMGIIRILQMLHIMVWQRHQIRIIEKHSQHEQGSISCCVRRILRSKEALLAIDLPWNTSKQCPPASSIVRQPTDRFPCCCTIPNRAEQAKRKQSAWVTWLCWLMRCVTYRSDGIFGR